MAFADRAFSLYQDVTGYFNPATATARAVGDPQGTAKDVLAVADAADPLRLPFLPLRAKGAFDSGDISGAGDPQLPRTFRTTFPDVDFPDFSFPDFDFPDLTTFGIIAAVVVGGLAIVAVAS